MSDAEIIEKAAPKDNPIRKVYEDMLRVCPIFAEYKNEKGEMAAFLLVLSFVHSYQTMLLTFNPKAPNEYRALPDNGKSLKSQDADR